MSDRPFVYINMAMTADGKITSAAREYPRFSTPNDRLRMDRLRAEADLVMVAAGTMRADNPALHVRSESMREYRRSLGKPEALHKMLVTASMNIALDSRFFSETDGGDRIIATVASAPADAVAAVEGQAEVWRVGSERVDLAEVLRLLKSRGVERVLAEGGPQLNWDLVRGDLVDEINVTISPALLGGSQAPTLLGGDGFAMADRRRLTLVDLDREDDELYARYRVER